MTLHIINGTIKTTYRLSFDFKDTRADILVEALKILSR